MHEEELIDKINIVANKTWAHCVDFLNNEGLEAKYLNTVAINFIICFLMSTAERPTEALDEVHKELKKHFKDNHKHYAQALKERDDKAEAARKEAEKLQA